MNTTEGQKAYDAFTKTGPAPSGKAFATWDALSDSAKAAWEAAATVARDSALTDAERKAAKAAAGSVT